MADLDISDYTTLKNALQPWLDREDDTDITTKLSLFVKLAEGHLNRRIKAVETDTALTGTVNSRSLTTSSLSIVEPLALWRLEDGDEHEVTKKRDGTFAYDGDSGRPGFWAIDASFSRIDMDRPLDQAYSFRFRYVERFALSDSVTTNWLLTNHPDVYLAACLYEGFNYLQSDSDVAKWKVIRDEGVSDVRTQLSQARKGTLSFDPGLSSINSRRYGAYLYDD